MSYVSDRSGRQYVVVMTGGRGRQGTTTGGSLIAYALPRGLAAPASTDCGKPARLLAAIEACACPIRAERRWAGLAAAPALALIVICFMTGWRHGHP